MVPMLCLLAAIPIGFIVISSLGAVRGSEFSPSDFTRRTFSYQQIPWVEWTLSGIQYDSVTPELDQTLVTEGFITATPSTAKANKTWHLYEDSAVPNSHDCDARFLTDYLDLHDWDEATSVSTPYWITWNQQFPRSAKVFWPTVADVARHEMYLRMPTMMQFAMERTKDNADDFRQALQRLTAAAWLELGKIDFQLGDFNRAALRLSRAKLLKETDDGTMLLDLCKKEVDDFDLISAQAKIAHESLNAAIEKLNNPDLKSERDEANQPTAEAEIMAEAELDAPEN
jgi:hypothetical protein